MSEALRLKRASLRLALGSTEDFEEYLNAWRDARVAERAQVKLELAQVEAELASLP